MPPAPNTTTVSKPPPAHHIGGRCVSAAVLVAIALSAAVAPAAAQGAVDDGIEYRADYRVEGTWTESVRADADEADTDGDGREEVTTRDQALGFAVTSSIPGVAFRDGRPAPRTTSITHGFPALTVAQSTLTESAENEPGTCRTHEPGTGGSAELVAAGAGLVLRPAEDVIFQLVCRTEHVEWGFAMDAMRAGGTLGQAPLDASFTVAPREIGAQRIVRPVAATALQRSPERCPREDPGHTVACSFAWTGSVVLERTDDGGPSAGRARLARGARSASVQIVCRKACAPVLSLSGARRRVSVPAGTSRITLPLDAATRRGVLRAGRAVLKVRLGGQTRSSTLRARRAR